MREVTAEVEANTNRANGKKSIKTDTTQKYDNTERMVGEASKNVETSSTGRSLKIDISQEKTSDGFQQIYPDSESIHTSNSILTNDHNLNLTHPSQKLVKREIKQEINDLDTLYGTYDEATNCITIICPGEDENVPIQECVQEVSNDESNHLTPKFSYKEHLSPGYTISESLSPESMHSDDSDEHGAYRNDDCEYESHDSAKVEKSSSNIPPLADPWHESFSILFPSLA